MERDFIAVLDFGGQYAHLIAKRVRHLGVYTKIVAPAAGVEALNGAKGVILSGGPQSVFGEQAVPFNARILDLELPILGLCYGHQLLSHVMGGEVRNLGRGEYGKTELRLDPEETTPLLEGLPPRTTVWMSHGDTVLDPPPGFRIVARTDLCPVAAMAHERRPLFGLQFHPEVTDTLEGRRILANFVRVTGARRGWNMETFMEEGIAACKAQVGARSVLMFLSGGVDSTVAFTLLGRALGSDRVLGLFIDTGFLRKNEPERVMAAYRGIGLAGVRHLDASAEFLGALAGKVDPQEKRRAVGETFIRVRDRFLADMNLDPEQWLLGQGTLYPDIIESGGSEHAEVIKSHHNRVQGVQDLIALGHVVEPLRELYKDEVRELGRVLGLPDSLVWRHPFPGPGLSINVLCATGEERFPELEGLRADLEALLEGSPFRGTLLPVRSVGVQGDQRTYTPPAVLQGPRDWPLLEAWSTRVTNAIRAVNRVVTLLAPERLPILRLHAAYCTKDRLALLAEADAFATDALERRGLMRDIFQLLVILLPLGNENGGECLVLRPVVSEDVMTARFARLPWELLEPLAEALLALPGIRAVFYDVSHKPPATFGWE
jgi:GMP synthase (glutamine-hydrolysing)